MKNARRFLICTLCILTLVLGSLLASCRKTCEHENIGEWTASGTAGCDGLPEKRVCPDCGYEETHVDAAKPAHTFGEWGPSSTAGKEQRACSSCGATESRMVSAPSDCAGNHESSVICENCLAELVSLPEIDFESWDSIGVKLQDFNVSFESVDYLTSSFGESISLAEVYLTLDENDCLYGYGSGVMHTKRPAVSQPDTQIAVTVLIEDGKLYVGLEGANPEPSVIETLDCYFEIDIERLSELATLEAELQENEEMINYVVDLLPELETWLTDDMIPVLEELKPGFDTTAIKTWYAKLLNSVWVRTADGTGAVLTADLEAYYEAVEKLGGMSILDLADDILGEGKSDELAEHLVSDEFLALSVSDVLNFIEADVGLDITELLATLDALAVLVNDDETATLESLLSEMVGDLPFEDIDDLLADEELTAFSMKDFILLAYCDFDETLKDALTQDEIDGYLADYREGIDEMFDDLDTMTVFDGSSPNSPYIEDVLENLKEEIDALEDALSLKVYLDAQGRVKSYVAKFTAPDASASEVRVFDGLTVTVTADSIVATIDNEDTIDGDDVGVKATLSLIPGMTVSANGAKVAAIKEKVAMCPSLTLAELEQMALAASVGSNSFAAVRDGKLYVIYWDQDSSGTSFDVYAYEPNALGTLLMPGCGDLVGISYLLSEGFAYDAYFTNNSSIVNISTWVSQNFDLILAECGEFYYDGDVDSFFCTYNTKTQTVVGYGNNGIFESRGHNFTTTRVVADECGEIGYSCRECADCGVVEYDYYTRSHSYRRKTEMKDPSAGPKGGYIVTRDCDECGEVASSYEISLNVPSDFVLTHIENNWGYLAFKFDVNEATAGTYRFFSTSGVDFDAALGYSTWGDQIDGYLVSDSSIGDFSLTVALTAGSTYGLEVRMYGYADAVITMQRID